MDVYFTLLFIIWGMPANLQMRAIKEELGDNDDDEDDVVALERKMQNAGMPPNIWKHAQRELR
jgi:ATP-dependent Lon protease